MTLRDSTANKKNDPKKLSNHQMAAISFAATNFPMENLIQADELLAFDEENFEQPARDLQRSIMRTDVADIVKDQKLSKTVNPNKSDFDGRNF
jgi:hypothetical protein